MKKLLIILVLISIQQIKSQSIQDREQINHWTTNSDVLSSDRCYPKQTSLELLPISGELRLPQLA